MAVRKVNFLDLENRQTTAMNAYLSAIVDALNLLEFGAGRYHELTVTIPDGYTANSDLTAISHNLRKEPEGWIIYYRGPNASGNLYFSAWTTTTATFKYSESNSSGSDITIEIRLF